MNGDEISISTDHPGGNVEVVERRGDEVKVEQEIRDSKRWWFYWNFKAEADDTEVVFEFQNGEVVGPWGPAISGDGLNWEWLGEESQIDHTAFKYDFSENEEVYLAFSLPYQVQNFESFYSGYEDHRQLDREVLTRTDHGREVPLLTIGDEHNPHDVVFTCRHHACESVASYVVEGATRQILENEPGILDDHTVHIIPFVDVDGVENGDQGKGRAPHDHNRDYVESNRVVDAVEPTYDSTRAIIDYLRDLGDLAISVDFHCPEPWGDLHDYPHIPKPGGSMDDPVEKISQNLKRSTESRSSAIEFDPSNNIEKGEAWNTGNASSYSNFAKTQSPDLACTIECPYFGVENNKITPMSSREFGANVARSVGEYIN
jgi:hypothetical protein